MHIFWTRLANFGHLGLISDPLVVSKFHNETHDPKGQENKIYTIVKGRETFYRRHTVPGTSCFDDKYVLKRVFFGSKECIKKLKPECAYFWAYYDKIENACTTCQKLNFSLPMRIWYLSNFVELSTSLKRADMTHFLLG